MLASVQFDNDQGFYTGKITNVDAYRMLPAKLEPGELSSAQMTPKQAFGVGWTLAKRARSEASAHWVTFIEHKYGEIQPLRACALDPSGPPGHLPTQAWGGKEGARP